MTIKVYPSFSGLFILAERETLVDGPNVLYSFACTRKGIEQTLKFYDSDNAHRATIMPILEMAEKDGRVHWGDRSDSRANMDWLVAKLAAMGGLSHEKQPYRSDDLYYRANENLPALREWLAEFAPSVVFMWE